MIRAQRRVHRALWTVLFPLLLGLFAYAVMRGYEPGPQEPPAVLQHGTDQGGAPR